MRIQSGRSLLVLIGSAVLLGSLAGAASSYYRQGLQQRTFAFSKPTATDLSPALGPAGLRQDSVRPRIVVDEGARFDFGVMSRNEQRSHTFVVRNQGDGPLVMSFIDKSCMCTDVTMTRNEVPPGESTEITLSWKPSTFNPEFEQTARFQTNDPSRIELDLTVAGKVQQLVQISPPSISFHDVTVGQQRDHSLRVFAYRDADLTVQKVEWLDPESATYFETEIEPVDPQVLAAETGAVAGQQISIRLKPGLAVGRYDQRLRLSLNHSELGPLEIPVSVTVVGYITVFGGKDYNRTTGLWTLGKLSGEQVHTRDLWIVVKGEHAGNVQLSVGQLDPAEVLQAELAASTTVGRPARYQLTLTLRPSEQVVNRLGNGQGELAEVVIETTDPDAPQLRIPVAFALETHREAVADSE
jgi:hypothetical protein